MQTQFSFRHNEFNIEVEWNDGNPSATIWSSDYKELLFTFDIDFEKVNAPDETISFESTSGGAGYDYKEVYSPINHYSHGFIYCKDEVQEFIIEQQPSWLSYNE